ncbi:hypothetical protein HETIRDRAFT_426785 [Heterobasidion irregulare TC 32-1]|uniref:GST N-terminal domain-containing protein n=1 Tax=Heterobasidion irregulare (strain TC 32-1) TaxID=747525 RepID=W4K6G1_HETIT|nr:uncharacterized protein HETIRDRAFT_426785 [Heterobasidion irregulare TC 32-1]ETW81324.1 hypothetical protein HETIRDRAFT_426785 [Heterobasidion irregulare TC 32-1]
MPLVKPLEVYFSIPKQLIKTLPAHSLITPPTGHRFALNMKALPYKTVWVEYPDIAGIREKLGAGPSGTRADEPLYTMPVIQDLATGAVVVDSFKIVQYLDTTNTTRENGRQYQDADTEPRHRIQTRP